MAYEAKGKITAIGGTQEISPKFSKRSFDITDSGTYPNGDDWTWLLVLEVTNDKCALLDNFNIGDDVKVMFTVSNVRGVNQQTGKPYLITNVKASSIELVNKAQQQPTTPTPITQTTQPLSAPSAPVADDDIPF